MMADPQNPARGGAQRSQNSDGARGHHDYVDQIADENSIRARLARKWEKVSFQISDWFPGWDSKLEEEFKQKIVNDKVLSHLADDQASGELSSDAEFGKKIRAVSASKEIEEEVAKWRECWFITKVFNSNGSGVAIFKYYLQWVIGMINAVYSLRHYADMVTIIYYAVVFVVPLVSSWLYKAWYRDATTFGNAFKVCYSAFPSIFVLFVVGPFIINSISFGSWSDGHHKHTDMNAPAVDIFANLTTGDILGNQSLLQVSIICLLAIYGIVDLIWKVICYCKDSLSRWAHICVLFVLSFICVRIFIYIYARIYTLIYNHALNTFLVWAVMSKLGSVAPKTAPSA